MRWDELFADLEAQLEAAAAAELAGEVRDRTRREHSLLGLVDRLRASSGHTLAVLTQGAGTVHGRLLDVGSDWILLEETSRSELLLSTAQVLGISGVGVRSDVPGAEGEVARRLDLRWALRGLARSRIGVQVVLVDGSVLAGTIDRVGADHVDLAEHAAGEARRASAVRQVRVLPLPALTAVRSWA
ncbi:MAG: uncharacterized protein JWO12_2325 [Frankiales bacterium]|nr:uncharacterized protein [Frankiales bacterium]